jgi:hypothetical protein
MSQYLRANKGVFLINLIIRMIKSRRVRWVGHEARVEERRNIHMVLLESQKERDHQEELDVGGRIILRCILKR